MTEDPWFALKGRVIVHAAFGAVLLGSVGFMKLEERSRPRYFFSVELSPDGAHLVRSVDETLRVEEVGSGRVRHEDRGLCAPAVWSDDGRTLAYLRSNGLRLVDLDSGRVRPGEEADTVALGPRGWPVVLADRGFSAGWPEKHAISLQHEGDPSPGPRFVPFEGPLPEHFHIEEFAFSPDGGLLAIGGTEANQRRSRVVVWDLREDYPLWEGHATVALVGLAFSPDGSTLALGGGAYEQGEVVLLDPWTGTERRRWERREFLSGPLQFSPDGRQIAFGGHDAGLLDVERCTLRWTVPSEESRIRSVRFVGDRLRTADELGFVKDLDLASGRVRSVLRRPESPPVDPRLWGAAVAGTIWLAFWVPLARRAARLRREATPYRPRFALGMLAAAALYAGASLLVPVLLPGWIDLGAWLTLLQFQFVGALAFLFAGVAFLVLRIPFRKRGFFVGLPLVAFGVVSQAWVWGAICASV